MSVNFKVFITSGKKAVLAASIVSFEWA